MDACLHTKPGQVKQQELHNNTYLHLTRKKTLSQHNGLFSEIISDSGVVNALSHKHTGAAVRLNKQVLEGHTHTQTDRVQTPLINMCTNGCFFSIALRFVCMCCWGVDHFQGGGGERGRSRREGAGGKSAAQIRKRHKDGQGGRGRSNANRVGEGTAAWRRLSNRDKQKI